MAEDRQTVTVEDYSRTFVLKITSGEGYTKESELQAAGKAFYSLLKRLAKDGDREDVRIPFKILKDEFGEEWRQCHKAKQEGLVQRLFRVLDFVHDECQANLSHSLQGNALSEMILEEFRLRIAKMVTGETWSDILPMRLAALKHMYKYMLQEMEFITQYSSTRLEHKIPDKPKFSAMGKFVRNLAGPAKNSWSAVFDDLFLKSGEKLAPLLFSLLDENMSLNGKMEASVSEETRNPASSRLSAPSSVAGSESGNLDAHSSTGKRNDSSVSGSNLIDLQEEQLDGEGSLRGTDTPSIGESSLAKVQAALERISTMESNTSSQQSQQLQGGWVAFEGAAQEPAGSDQGRNKAWSPEDRRCISHSGSLLSQSANLDRPPMPKSFSRGSGFLGLRSDSMPPESDRGSMSGLSSSSLKSVSFSRHFDNLDPLKKSVN